MQNPWNFVIPVLKVSVTKVEGFLDLRDVNFDTSCHIMYNSSKWWKLEVTKTQNPWNFIIPVLKVSVTKVEGFLDLREVNFETSCHIACIASKWWKLEVTEKQNPLNLIIPVFYEDRIAIINIEIEAKLEILEHFSLLP